mmetsp:Transcript_3355/g.11825  ORF Transcript_3355/g.11825 Transcript_3355/m.11825 type:complete len:254 (-) Transcript_3355:2204-2965(-)
MMTVSRTERTMAPAEDLSLRSRAERMAVYLMCARVSMKVYSRYPRRPILNPIMAIMYQRTLQRAREKRERDREKEREKVSTFSLLAPSFRRHSRPRHDSPVALHLLLLGHMLPPGSVVGREVIDALQVQVLRPGSLVRAARATRGRRRHRELGEGVTPFLGIPRPRPAVGGTGVHQGLVHRCPSPKADKPDRWSSISWGWCGGEKWRDRQADLTQKSPLHCLGCRVTTLALRFAWARRPHSWTGTGCRWRAST